MKGVPASSKVGNLWPRKCTLTKCPPSTFSLLPTDPLSFLTRSVQSLIGSNYNEEDFDVMGAETCWKAYGTSHAFCLKCSLLLKNLYVFWFVVKTFGDRCIYPIIFRIDESKASQNVRRYFLCSFAFYIFSRSLLLAQRSLLHRKEKIIFRVN